MTRASGNPSPRRLRLASGIGLVVANMVGVGFLFTAGFMAVDLTPGEILAGWGVGGLMAMAGALAYAALATRIPRSGGEYRYLHDLVHPAAGTLAGWTSFLVGFSAPIAVTAAVLGPFAETVVPGLDGDLAGAVVIVLLTIAHAFNFRMSAATQDALAATKLLLLALFILMGIFAGRGDWPTWQPSTAAHGFPLAAFMGHLVWVLYAYSGWNATAYVADEFEHPARDVPRAMLLGAALVTILYLLVNFILVANLTAERLASFATAGDRSRITLGHIVATDLLGEMGGVLMSVFVVLALASTVSALTFAGPRVYAAMARDGFLPRALAAKGDRPPTFAVLLQGALALLLFTTHTFELLVSNIGAVLTLTSALTVLSLFRLRFAKGADRPGALSLAAALAYFGASVFLIYHAVQKSPAILLWMGVVVAVTTGGYFLMRRTR